MKTKYIPLKNRCNDLFFLYEIRTYYYCQLKKGHIGDHQNISIQTWKNKK